MFRFNKTRLYIDLLTRLTIKIYTTSYNKLLQLFYINRGGFSIFNLLLISRLAFYCYNNRLQF